MAVCKDLVGRRCCAACPKVPLRKEWLTRRSALPTVANRANLPASPSVPGANSSNLSTSPSSPAANSSNLFTNSYKNPASTSVRATNSSNILTSTSKNPANTSKNSTNTSNLVTNGGTDGAKCGKNAEKHPFPAAGGQKETVDGEGRATGHGNRILKGFQHPAQGFINGGPPQGAQGAQGVPRIWYCRAGGFVPSSNFTEIMHLPCLKTIRSGFVAALLASVALLTGMLSAPAKPSPPEASLNLKLAAPIKTWDEAVPLGNGTMGVLLWGETNRLRLSLDRGDLWDERPSKAFLRVRDKFNWATLQQLVASNRMDEFNEICDANYDYNTSPTKLPAGRVEITLDESQMVEAFELNLATAEGVVHGKAGELARVFVNAGNVPEPVALVRIAGPPLKDVRLKTPASVKKLNYPAPRTGEADGLRWFEQEAADGFAYAICAAWKRVGDSTLLAVTVATSGEGKSPQAVAEARVKAALKAGYEKLFAPHADWWAQFWEHSSVNVPEPEILRHYYLVRYLSGAASRRGAPPMPLQGVWSADAGSLPPWKGDYHNDLNTQMTYLAYRTAGDFDEGLSFLDFLWDRLPVFRKFAKDFYHAPGAAVPGVMSLAGQALGGWGQYSVSPTMGAWNAHLFYLHWRATGDEKFLRDRAYPFCREIGTCLRALLKPDTNGVLVLPLSSSPEIFDNSRRAFLKPNSNYDLASMKMLFLTLAEMAAATGDSKSAADWTATAKQLGEFHAKPDGTLLLDETTPLPGSHRHLSNLMALHPFNLITADGDERDRQIIAASLGDWASKGTGAWCGYSFSWMSCLRARVGDAETALRNLDIYVHAFILRNGFHANGDQTKSGFSGFTYRPFTLEGNFLAMEAVHEMLLQSWSAQPGSGDWGAIRIFPAPPWRWHDAAFTDLRAEGGHRVSAKRENNATTWLRVIAGRDGVIRIRDNFGGREPKWNLSGAKKVGDNFEFVVKKDAVIEATLVKPDALPPAPADLAEPVVIQPPSAIQSNKLPLRIGADSDGNNRFTGDLARVAIFNRVLDAAEITKLADKNNANWDQTAGAVLTLNGEPAAHATAGFNLKLVEQVEVVPAAGGLDGKMFHLTGTGYLEIPHRTALNCPDGVTLAAWIRPTASPAGGMRIIDKSPVGAASAYLLDTYPNNSLRLITRDPQLIFDAKLPLNEWTHVVATVNGKTGKQVLFINGKPVAESP